MRRQTAASRVGSNLDFSPGTSALPKMYRVQFAYMYSHTGMQWKLVDCSSSRRRPLTNAESHGEVDVCSVLFILLWCFQYSGRLNLSGC